MLIMFSALLLQTSAAQPPQTNAAPPAQAAVTLPPPNPQVKAVVDAWGECLNAGVAAVPASQTPEAAAPGIISGCATQQSAIAAAVEGWINGASMTAEQQAEVRRRLGTLENGLTKRVADRIRSVRAVPTGR